MAQNRLLTLISHFLSQIWQFFRIPFPTTQVPIGAILFLPMVVAVALAFFRHMFGIGNFADLSKVPFMAVGKVNRIKQSRYDAVSSHAESVSNTLSSKG